MKNHRVIFAFLVLFCAIFSFAGQWEWVPDERVLNPSGLEIESRYSAFQVIDWNKDGWQDFIINNPTGLTYFQNTGTGESVWRQTKLDLPQISDNKMYPYDTSYPKDFYFIDWDHDGDVDLFADSLVFFRNLGTNRQPQWQKQESPLPDFNFSENYYVYNYFIFDYDADKDWDVICSTRPFEVYSLFLNTGDESSAHWIDADSLLPAYQGWGWPREYFKLVDLTEDGIMEYIGFVLIPADPGFFYQFTVFQNLSSADRPEWRGYETDQSWGGSTYYYPYFAVADLNNDGENEFIKTDDNVTIASHRFSRENQSVTIVTQPDYRFGQLNVRSHAKPFIYHRKPDKPADLYISFDEVYSDWFLGPITIGYYTYIKERMGHFDVTDQIRETQPLFTGEVYLLKNNFTFSFADMNHDSKTDLLAGYNQINSDNQFLYKGILFFKNTGSDSLPHWQPDSSLFSYFYQPDSNFYQPSLSDFNFDGEPDLFIEKNGVFTFYERKNTAQEEWWERPDWADGLGAESHYSAAIADLTCDGLVDIVFGQSDGTLLFYQNTGSSESQKWQRVNDAFDAIDVGENAAPAFVDINHDCRPDMIVGNAAGKLAFYQNESTVDVEQKGSPLPSSIILYPNYPNPFNASTVIEYQLDRQQRVRISIYNVTGQLIRKLFDGVQPPGRHKVVWDTNDFSKYALSSGIYFYELEVMGHSSRQKMLLLK